MPLINPSRSANEPTITGPCLLLINPDEMRSTAAWARKQGGNFHRLFNGELIEMDNNGSPCYIAGPAIGAPMAVMTLEKLIALGATDIIVYGWCGALSKPVKSGDLVIGRWGHSGEGTSSHYPVPGPVDASARLCNWLTTNFSAQPEKMWSTDAPYRELRSTIAQFGGDGIRAVDMEFTALATVAVFRGVDLAALFLVSDELYHEDWRPAFHGKGFKKKSRAIIQDLCQRMSTL